MRPTRIRVNNNENHIKILHRSLNVFHISKSSGVSTLQTDKKLSYICVTINKNDSLWSIAKKYEDRYEGSFDDFITEIKRCNGLKSNTIYAGRQIVIPVVIYNEKISKYQ